MARRTVVKSLTCGSARDHEPPDQKYLDRSKVCFVCTIRKVLLLSRFLGFSPLRWSCPHSNPPTRQTIQICYLSYTVCTLISIGYLLIGLYNGYDLTTFDFTTEKMKVLYLFNDTIHLYMGGCYAFCSLLQIRQRIEEYGEIIRITESRADYYVPTIYCKKRNKWINRVAVPTWCVSVFLFVIFLVVNVLATSGEASVKYYIQIIAANWGLAIGLSGLLQFVTSCYIYGGLFEELGKNMVFLLDLYRKDPVLDDVVRVNWQYVDLSTGSAKNISVASTFKQKNQQKVKPIVTNRMATVEGAESVSLLFRLRKLRRLYSDYIENLTHFNEVYNPSLILVTMLVLLSLILNIYLVVIPVFEESLWGIRVLQAAMKLSVAGLGLWAYFDSVDRIQNHVKAISKYLYLYPISGLEIEEAEEIATFLETLHNFPAAMTASGVFNIRTSAIVSISGTVVTYVLVALQFQVVLQEELDANKTSMTIM